MSNIDIYEIMDAAALPETVKNQKFGAWSLFRQTMPMHMLADALGRESFATLTQYVKPKNVDYSNIHRVKDDGTVLDVVMEDSPRELKKHIPIWLYGKGHVLKTGLGLGCVVRGLLTKSDVEHISVIEIDADIIRVIGDEFKNNPRVSIYHANALTFDYSTLPEIDYAWHDIWCPENDGLQVLHGELIKSCFPFSKKQGAWAFPREFKRAFRSTFNYMEAA